MLRISIGDPRLSGPFVIRQTVAEPWAPRRFAASALWLVALWLATTGCNSIYHRTRLKLPPEPCAQLKIRVEEARRVERFATQAGGTLREHLHRGAAAETLQTDLDRLAMATFDLERRLAAARDLAGACEQQSQLIGELERLKLRTKAWQDFVEAAGQADPTVKKRQLDALLRSSPLSE